MATVNPPTPARQRVDLLTWWDRLKSNYWVRSLFKMIAIVWVVSTLTFFIIRALPGNPVDIFTQTCVDQGYSEEECRTRAESLFRIDFDRPLGEQYIEFMGNLLRGDMGDSYVLAVGKPVMEIVIQRLPWTLFSVGTSLLISFVLGMFLGMVAAYKRNSWIDLLLTNVGAFLHAIPAVLIAILLVLLLGVIWKVVPFTVMRGSHSSGVQAGFTLEFLVDVFKHYAVPGFVYVLATVGSWIILMRSSTVSTLGDDYVAVARARGLPDFRIITAYVGRNASLPLVTALSISLGYTVGGSTLIESVFTYQGIGMLLSQAITKRDYTVMQGILMATTIMVILSIALADLLYGWLDPRIRITGEEK